MNRRSVLGGIFGAVAAAFGLERKEPLPEPMELVQGVSPIKPLIRGVGVLRCPNKVYEHGMARDLARELADAIQPGSILVLPNTRDHMNEYEWDFRIEAGDPTEARVERTDGPPQCINGEA